MIASVEGKVGAVAFDSVVLEVGGIGYRIFAAPAILVTAVPGSTVTLFTYHLVREDQQALFGFRSAEDLGFFTLLLTVTGVGPKVALAIVGSRPTPDLQLAIMAQDNRDLKGGPNVASSERYQLTVARSCGESRADRQQSACSTASRPHSAGRCGQAEGGS